MKTDSSFRKQVAHLAIPVALQSMLQSSFSMIDQLMIGQLGSVRVAGVGMAGKFSSIYSVVISAVGAVAGIMISQYFGQENEKEVRRSFVLNLLVALGTAALFLILCVSGAESIMQLYTEDAEVCKEAAGYLRTISGTFFPMAGAALLSVLFRCEERPALPLYASILSALLNTVLNYGLIFGIGKIPPMGVQGAAIATVISQWANFLLMLFMIRKDRILTGRGLQSEGKQQTFSWYLYGSMLFPILICEVLWSVGENVYAMIYGHMGTDASAAMTLTNPVQGILIGALCGLSQAAGVMIGKLLGKHAFEEAYEASKKLLVYGTAGSLLLSLAVAAVSPFYPNLYQVEPAVKELTRQILLAYALAAPFKVLNMILGGGIIRSGGRTRYVMVIDMIGTWVFGVPIGLVAAFVWKLSIPYVYFLLSMEEAVRFFISLWLFRTKRWMHNI